MNERIIGRLFFTALAVLVAGQIVFGQSSAARQIDAYMAPLARSGHFSGVVLAAQDGKIVYEKAFGLANADFKIPNQINTRIGIASITKPMTSVILIRLIEEQKIALADKVSKYIPDFPNGDKITIEILSRHRAGIPHRVMKPEEESVPHSSADMVERIKQATLLFEPGTQYSYSSAGYTLLARILEIASGKTYAQLLQQYVFTPAGMKDSLDFDGATIIDRRAQDYMVDSRGIINAALKDYSFLVGAGSVFSTARDVYLFGDAMVSGKLGDTVKTNWVRNNVFSASGSTNGHRSFLKMNVEKKYGYVLIANLQSGANDLALVGLDSILEGKETKPPVIPNPKFIPNAEKTLAEFAGHYEREGGGGAVDVVVKDSSLIAGDIRFYAIRPDCFFEYRFYGDVCFARDAAGKVKEARWVSPTATSVWVKK